MKQILNTCITLGVISCCAYGCYFLNKTDILKRNSAEYNKGYNVGYEAGWNKSHETWRLTLVDADLAEYNKKTGEWQFIPLEEIVMAATVLGKSKVVNNK